MTSEQPAFEIRNGQKVYRVYASGRVEGFEGELSFVNRIPLLIAEAVEVNSRPSES